MLLQNAEFEFEMFISNMKKKVYKNIKLCLKRNVYRKVLL